MSQNNGKLLMYALVLGVLGYFSYSSNFSLKNYLKFGSEYKPSGPKPTSTWERNWESIRAN